MNARSALEMIIYVAMAALGGVIASGTMLSALLLDLFGLADATRAARPWGWVMCVTGVFCIVWALIRSRREPEP
jgi:hypothetical protein